MPTIGQALSWELPTLTSKPTSDSKKNTNSTTKIVPSSWQQWPGYALAALSIFDYVLQMDYQGPPMPPTLPEDCEISSEDTVTMIYTLCVMSLVNHALRSAGLDVHIGPGSRHGFKADWDGAMGETIYFVGDSKLNHKWWPTMVEDARRQGNPAKLSETIDEWRNVVGQVQGYAARCKTRYGFIASDGGVTVLRLRSSPIPDSTVQTRPRGSQPVPDYRGHQRGLSDITMTSAGSTEAGFSDSDYDATEPANFVLGPPEYDTAPWRGRGPGQLTPAQALLFQALLAVKGDIHIAPRYPPLDSWRQLPDGSYKHNSSGLVRQQLPQGAALAEPSNM